MVVGRDLDAVDQLGEELLHDVGAGVVDDALGLRADLADELAAGGLGAAAPGALSRIGVLSEGGPKKIGDHVGSGVAAVG